MRIRPATPADAGVLRDIVQRAYGGYVELIGRRPAPMDDDYPHTVARATVLVAVAADVICGLIVLSSTDDHLLIENVAVEPDHQHAGIGRALLAHAERIARERGLRVVRLYTNAAMGRNLEIYGRLGYVETERSAQSGFARVYLAKRLDAGEATTALDADDAGGAATRDASDPPLAD